MEVLGPAQEAPTQKELIQALSKHISLTINSEMADESDIDRVWILRKIHKAYLYYRDLAYFAPAMYQGLVDATGIDGTLFPEGAQGAYDYTQNIYRGYCRKLEAVLGTRIPNATAVPDDPSSETDQAAARAANDAAQYIRQHCELQVQVLWLVFSLFNFGTSFWHIDWVEDGDLNGWKEVPQTGEGSQTLGADDPDLSGGFQVPVPEDLPPQRLPKGALEISLFDASEISVPLDADGRRGVKDCHWLRREREQHKSGLLQQWGEVLRADKDPKESLDLQSSSFLYGESIRSAMASPIGVVRPRRENRWTVIDEYWTPRMYQMVDDKSARGMLQENFPEGLQITAVKGRIVALTPKRLVDVWQECQPEPTQRIMCDPLGDDWMVTQDILNNLLNQQNESVERSNEPGFADPSRVDLDAWQRRRDNPGDLIPALRPAGGTLADLIFRPPPLQFSEQIPAFRAQVEETSRETSGLLEAIWGGDTSDPTARQTELKTNAAIRQLGVIWVMIGKSLEQVYLKACKILSENEDGILAFSKKNQFGKFDTVSVVMEDLRGGSFHFEADEAIPMTWGQQRDLLMWMLDKPEDILRAWGLDDPLNIYEFKALLGMPGMRVPHLDDRDKGMSVIGKLLQEVPTPGPPDPQSGQLGPPSASIPPDWEDDSEFMAKLAKAYLINNFTLAQSSPDGYQNVVLWGQAHEKKANQAPTPPPPKTSVSVALKGEDIGNAAVQDVAQKAGILDPGVLVQQAPMQKQPPMGAGGGLPMPPPGPGGPSSPPPPGPTVGS